ncbi:Predicted arabinose efflux permease, MFS family [Micromonospora coriariae]|uniref:Predicted arabinose efflux permease, MFS family n=1 Tax=Micromonospora coriariae TaxID=285665 RepID=A0A1C4VJC7_9ACTN|nr:MFS transporter [Micromonospora coriariae]SCE83869.1 Predicted arabinose efflux permease, MFS family [Micromonospora coriariae]
MNDTTRTPAPDSARTSPIRAGAGAVLTTVACVLPVFLLGGLAVQMGADLGFSPAGLGLAVAVYFGVSALASVPSGRLVERYGPAMVARCGIVLAAGSMLAVAVFARSYPALVALLALSATANALGQLASNAVLAQHVPARRQGLSFGVKQSAIPVSTLLAGAAVPTIALTAGWRWAFVAAAGAALTTLPAVPRQMPDRARRADAKRAGRATVALVVIGVAATLAAAAANALGTFLVDSAAARGLSPGLAGLTLTLGSAVCVVARVGAGWLADRRTGGHVALIAAMLVVGAGGLGLLALTGAVPLVAGVVLGFGLGWAWPGLMNFAVVRLHPQAPAAATSITQTGVYAGGCLGPLSLGPLAAHLGYPAMWTTAAVSMLLAAALMLVGSRLLTRIAAGANRTGDQLVRSAM